MNHQTPPAQLSDTNNKSLIYAFSIILTGILVATTILFSTGISADAYRTLRGFIPKFGKYNSLKDISDYQNLYSVFSSQPQLSFNTNSRFLFVENSDANCVNCAKFHGYGQNSESTFSKLKADYIETGKMDYIFTDKLIFDSLKKHNSTYCVAEQDAKTFFEYKEKLYQSYSENFDINKAKSLLQFTRIDLKKFEECFNSKKYDDRVNKLSNFSGSVLDTSGTPAFYIFHMQNKEVTKSDGSKSQEKEYTLLYTIEGNLDYDVVLKPRIEETLKKY